MGIQLDQYYANLVETGDVFTLTSRALGFTKREIQKLEAAVASAKKAIDSAENLDDFAEDLRKILLVLKTFPPLKSLVKIAEKVVKSAENKTGDFIEDLAAFDTEIQSFEQRIKFAKETVKSIKRDFDGDRADIKAALPGVERIKAVFDADPLDAPASFAVLESNVEILLGDLNTAFPQERLDALLSNISATRDALAALSPISAVFTAIADAFDATLSKFSFLDGPLDGLVDALSGFLWVLEKIEAIISFVLDPIIDPILDATGLTDLIDDLASGITGLLPDLDILAPFDSFGADLTAIFGGVSTPTVDVDISFIQDLLNAKNTLYGLLYGEAGFLAPLFAEGTDGFDLMIGRPGFAAGAFEIGAANFAAGEVGDILVGSSIGDVLSGGGGNDMIVATAGDDMIDGGDGDEDIYATTGSFADYAYLFTENAPGDVTLTLLYQGADPGLIGLDRITGVEYLIFAGTTLRVADLDGAITGQNGVENLLNGTPGVDLILGGDLADTINGLGGDDRIAGFAGRDIIDGGDGVDTVDYSSEVVANRVAVLDPTNPRYAESDDVLINVENLIGGAGSDTLLGDENANRLSGRGGANDLAGYGGNDILNAGTVTGGGGAVNNLAGGAGDDILLGGGGPDVYFAGSGSDTYRDFDTGNEQNQVFYGYDTSGYVALYEGIMALDFAAGIPDRIVVRVVDEASYEVEKIYGGAIFVDTLEGGFRFSGTGGNDVFELKNLSDIMFGGDGDDLFIGYTPDVANVPESFGDPFLSGGLGDDRLISFSGDENFRGNDGSDTVELRITRDGDYAADADDVLDAGGAVIENAGPRERDLIGDDDTDTLDLSQSDLDWVFSVNDGENGYDRFSTMISTFDIAPGAQVDERSYDARLDYRDLSGFDQSDNFRVASFERVIGSEFSDAIVFEDNFGASETDADFEFQGNGGDDYIWAYNLTGDLTADLGDGDDEIIAGQGADNVTGGDGNDRIYAVGNAAGALEFYDAGAGNDYVVLSEAISATGRFDFIGGAGRDLLDFAGFADALEMDIAAQTYDVDGGAITGAFTGFEAAIGGSLSNVMTGDDGDNILSGGARDDTIFGGGGNDVLYTGSKAYEVVALQGTDMIYGGAGNDLIFANSGNGLIDGGTGTDTLRLAGLLRYSESLGFDTLYSREPERLVALEWTVDLESGRADQIGFGRFFPDTPVVSGGFDLVSIESVVGGLWDDTMIAASADAQGNGSYLDGSDGDDTLIGKDGADTLVGGRGDDRMIGAGGDDVFTPGGGNNTVYGGAGEDTLDLGFGATDLTIDAATGSASYTFDDQFPLAIEDTPAVMASTVRFDGIEVFNLTGGDDSFKGADLDEVVRGGGGDDILIGGGGADRLFGGAGDDDLQGFGVAGTPVPDLIFLNQNGARNDYITSGIDANIPNVPLTIELLMQADPLTQLNTLISYANGSTDNAFALYAVTEGGGQLQFIFNGATAWSTGLSTDALFDGQLHRLSLVLDYYNDRASIYIDGVLRWSDTDTRVNYVSDYDGILVFGQDQDTRSTEFDENAMADNQAFIGGMGDIRIFDEIVDDQAIYDRAFTAIEDPASNTELWQYWTVDAENEVMVTQPTAQNNPETLTVTTVAGQTPGIIWSETESAPDQGNYLNGGGGNDRLEGGAFADELFDAFGDNVLIGGGGDDLLTVMSGSNELFGDAGADLLIGGVGSDALTGGTGDDVIVADTAAFLVGNDTIFGGQGDDDLQGGGGSDLFVFRTGDGDDVIGRLAVDPDDLSNTQAVGIDFEVGFDRVRLEGFGYADTSEVMAQIADEGGFAVFRDQGTSVTFFGLQADQLSADDFIFV